MRSQEWDVSIARVFSENEWKYSLECRRSKKWNKAMSWFTLELDQWFMCYDIRSRNSDKQFQPEKTPTQSR